MGGGKGRVRVSLFRFLDYLYVYACVRACVCVCVCERERERERERENLCRLDYLYACVRACVCERGGGGGGGSPDTYQPTTTRLLEKNCLFHYFHQLTIYVKMRHTIRKIDVELPFRLHHEQWIYIINDKTQIKTNDENEWRRGRRKNNRQTKTNVCDSLMMIIPKDEK